MYIHECAVCHGSHGKGDGIAGVSLNPIPTNFFWEEFQSQTDGSIYYKITVGKIPMAGYGSTMSEIERWQLVNYLRTFHKK